MALSKFGLIGGNESINRSAEFIDFIHSGEFILIYQTSLRIHHFQDGAASIQSTETGIFSRNHKLGSAATEP